MTRNSSALAVLTATALALAACGGVRMSTAPPPEPRLLMGQSDAPPTTLAAPSR